MKEKYNSCQDDDAWQGKASLCIHFWKNNDANKTGDKDTFNTGIRIDIGQGPLWLCKSKWVGEPDYIDLTLSLTTDMQKT